MEPFAPTARYCVCASGVERHAERDGGVVMNGIIYLVGLVVIVMAVLSFVGLH